MLECRGCIMWTVNPCWGQTVMIRPMVRTLPIWAFSGMPMRSNPSCAGRWKDKSGQWSVVSCQWHFCPMRLVFGGSRSVGFSPRDHFCCLRSEFWDVWGFRWKDRGGLGLKPKLRVRGVSVDGEGEPGRNARATGFVIV